MKKIISILLCLVSMFTMLCGCSDKNKDTNYINDYESIHTEQNTSQPKELIEYISPYDKGIRLGYQYYSKWLNIYFDDMGVSDYRFFNTNLLQSEGYINAMRYYGGSENQITELEIIDNHGLKNGFIGVYVEDCNGKTLNEHINELKNNTLNKLKDDLANRDLIWEFKDNTEFILCNQKYNMLTIEFKETDSNGNASIYDSYTYWELCRKKDNKLITIHCSGISKENKIKEMLSAFEEIGTERKQIRFGSYEQDDITSNGTEDIEWYILEEDTANKKALIISKQALSYQSFLSTDHVQTDDYYTYEKSYIRTWLNTDFLNNAFSQEEKRKILVTNVSAEKYPEPESDANPGNSTADKVFILSFSEFEKYFTIENDKACQLVSKAVSQQIKTKHPNMYGSENTYYKLLLRNIGRYKGYSSYIDEYGNIKSTSAFASGIVYPAMWITLE